MLIIVVSGLAWQQTLFPSHLRGAVPPACAARTPQPQARQISHRVAEFGKNVEAATTTGWQQMQAQLDGFERALADASFLAQSASAKAGRAKAEAAQAAASAEAARAAQARGLLSARAEQAEATAAAATARAWTAEAAAAVAAEGQAQAELAVAGLEISICHARACRRLLTR